MAYVALDTTFDLSDIHLPSERVKASFASEVQSVIFCWYSAYMQVKEMEETNDMQLEAKTEELKVTEKVRNEQRPIIDALFGHH